MVEWAHKVTPVELFVSISVYSIKVHIDCFLSAKKQGHLNKAQNTKCGACNSKIEACKTKNSVRNTKNAIFSFIKNIGVFNPKIGAWNTNFVGVRIKI